VQTGFAPDFPHYFPSSAILIKWPMFPACKVVVVKDLA